MNVNAKVEECFVHVCHIVCHMFCHKLMMTKDGNAAICFHSSIDSIFILILILNLLKLFQ